MRKFTSKTKLEKFLESSEIREILSKHNVPCLTCPFAEQEMDQLNIGEICKMYGLDLEKLLTEVNKTIDNR